MTASIGVRVLALWALVLSAAAVHAAQRSSGSAGGPSGSGERGVGGLPASDLAFPRGLQTFEELKAGANAACIRDWEFRCPDPARFSVHAAGDVLGLPAGRPGSARWLRVSDLALNDWQHGFRTNAILPPSARDYTWSFALLVEALPATGPAWPALMSQHEGPGGTLDLCGIELAADGLYLVVRALGGDPARAKLCAYSGATALGQWIEIELAPSFDRGTVAARVNGGAPAVLALHPRRGTSLSTLRFAYHGEGPGNAATFLLDDLALAFGSSVCEEALRISFDTEDDSVTALVNGQDLSTPPEFGELFAISGAGANLGPAIFDSTPGGPNDPSQDPDLLVGLGNLVVLQGNDAPAQSVPGIFDRPNDDRDGGTVFFAFTRPLEVRALDLVDVDQGVVQRATVTLTDRSGKTRAYDVPNGWTEDVALDGPPGFRTLDTTSLLPQPGFTASATAVEDAGFDPGAVVLLAVHFGSSGGLDNLELVVPCVTLDFETEDDGTTPLVNGQDVSTPPEFGALVSIASSGPNAGAAVFDSTPGGPNDPSQDLDLLVGLGNLLILQNDDASISLLQTVPGIYDFPNDDDDGGALVFTFPAPAAPRRVDLVDIDPGLANSSSVVLTDASGKRRTFSVPAGWTEDLVTGGPPGFRTLDLRYLLPQIGFAASATAVEDPGFDQERVTRIDVNLGSSGAVDNLCFCP